MSETLGETMADRSRAPGRRAAPPRATFGQRVGVGVLSVASRVLRHLPEPLLQRAAHAAGAGLCLAQPGRRALVRANLGRVCAYLDATDRGSPAARAAARDPRALDRLVRRAFGHYVRGYLEMTLAEGYTPASVEKQLLLEDPAAFEATLAAATAPDSRGLVLVALHFGSIELAGMWLNARSEVPMTVPMETLANPALQDFVSRGRRATGIRLVPAERAARELRTAIGRHEVVAFIADRPLDKPGHAVPFFGAPAPLPVGPALLAIDSGATVAVAAARRTGWSGYAGRVVSVPVPETGTRRERVERFMAAEVSVFESIIGEAPEQWWTLFFPIWPDLVPGDGR